MKRSAFTRVELVVVIVVLCALAALMLPALQFPSDRGARRSECLNHLKQIAMACLNHEATFKVLPNSGYDRGSANSSIPTFLGPKLSPGVGDRQQAGWAYQILPFMEQSALWEGGEHSTTLAEKQAFAATGSIPSYFCPARRRPTIANGRGMIDYAAASTCSGLLADMEDLESDPGIDCAIRRNRNTFAQITAGETLVYSISSNGIKDGTSNVMLIGEKQMNLFNEPPVEDDDQGYCVGHDIDIMRTCAVPPQKDYVDVSEGPGGGNRVYRFGSSHPGVIVVAMCDGSTRTISYDIDQQTFFNLGRRRDGAELKLDDYY
jgi:hypothetical protein